MKRLYQGGLALLLMLSVAACDALQNAEDVALSEEEAQAVAEIVAQALADQNDGMMTDLYEGTAVFDQSGMYYLTGSVTSKNGDEVQDPHDNWRGVRRGFQVEYDSATGTHTVRFVHEVTRPNFQKSIEALLQYVFKDREGQFIARPRAERDRIASIEFEGFRKGSVAHRMPMGNERSVSFERRAIWHIEGLEAESDTITFEGEQQMEGARHFMNGRGQEVEMEFRSHLVTDGPIYVLKHSEMDSLEHLTYGTLAFQVRMVRRTPGKEIVREVEGTIEMNGDGSALMRFYGIPQTYRIFLGTGEVKRDS